MDQSCGRYMYTCIRMVDSSCGRYMHTCVRISIPWSCHEPHEGHAPYVQETVYIRFFLECTACNACYHQTVFLWNVPGWQTSSSVDVVTYVCETQCRKKICRHKKEDTMPTTKKNTYVYIKNVYIYIYIVIISIFL